MRNQLEGPGIALLSQEGSGIAKRSREGWFPSRNTSALEPPRLRFAQAPLLTQEGNSPRNLILYSFIDRAFSCPDRLQQFGRSFLIDIEKNLILRLGGDPIAELHP